MASKITRVFIAIALCMLCLSAGSAVGASWVNATGGLAGTSTECGTIQGFWAVPNTHIVIAGIAGNGLWATTNSGTTWAKMGGTSGNAITNRPMQMVFDPADPNTWYECGIYASPGVFKTTNGGATWTPLGNTYHHDGIGVDFSDPQRKTLLAGTHETSSTLWKSTDGGENWTNIGGQLPAGTGFSSFPYIINAQTYLMNISTNGGIYRSDDGGSTWTKVCTHIPSSAIIKASAGDLYCSGPSGTVLKGSADGTTWTSIPCAGAKPFAPIEVPGGKIAIATSNGIAMTADKGATWKTFGNPLPQIMQQLSYARSGLAYDAVAGSFYTWHDACSFTPPVTISSDAVWRFDTLMGSTQISMPSNKILAGAARPAGLRADMTTFDISGRVITLAKREVINPTTRQSLYIVRTGNGMAAKMVRTGGEFAAK